MDTSELYIDMCRKAVEIQKLDLGSKIYNEDEDEEHKLTSFYYLPHAHKISILKWDNDEGHYISGGYRDNQSDAVWLPRQDQLQEMVKSDEHPHWQLNDFIDSGQADYQQETSDYAKQFTTMEQLWLAFVMKEKFNKVWKNGDWIEDK